MREWKRRNRTCTWEVREGVERGDGATEQEGKTEPEGKGAWEWR